MKHFLIGCLLFLTITSAFCTASPDAVPIANADPLPDAEVSSFFLLQMMSQNGVYWVFTFMVDVGEMCSLMYK